MRQALASGRNGAVYEATQLSLRRAVALRLIPTDHFDSPDDLDRFDDRQRRASSVHHPNLVALYEAGEWEGGRFVASRLIRGRSLAELLEERAAPVASSLEPLRDALLAAHAAGLAHGAVSVHNILVDREGMPYLTDLGLAPDGDPEADLRDLDRVASALPTRAPRKRTPALLAVGAVAFAGVAALAVLSMGGGGESGEPSSSSAGPPPRPAGTTSIGSTLAAASFEPLGCAELVSSNTPACTIVQEEIGGQAVEVPEDAVIRGWAVRGASGGLALQVIRERGGDYLVVGSTPPYELDSPAPRRFGTDIQVRAGDMIAIELSPGAVIGSIAAQGESSALRFNGVLTPDPRSPSATVEAELMLRVDIKPGGNVRDPALITGVDAAEAPSGDPLAEVGTSLANGQARVVVVELESGIAIDLFRGGVRLARVDAPDADPAGELIALEPNCGSAGGQGFCLRWQNPGSGPPLHHAYQVRPSGEIKLVG